MIGLPCPRVGFVGHRGPLRLFGDVNESLVGGKDKFGQANQLRWHYHRLLLEHFEPLNPRVERLLWP